MNLTPFWVDVGADGRQYLADFGINSEVSRVPNMRGIYKKSARNPLVNDCIHAPSSYTLDEVKNEKVSLLFDVGAWFMVIVFRLIPIASFASCGRRTIAPTPIQSARVPVTVCFTKGNILEDY